MSKAILAIDPGSKLGWALWESGAPVESGCEDFALRRGESPGARFLRFRAWLADIQARWPIGLVIYEQAHHRGGAATEVCVGFTTRCQEFAAQVGAECVAVHTATLKKRVGGSGRAGKPEMIAAAHRHFPTKQAVTDDNEADALCLLALALADYRAGVEAA